MRRIVVFFVILFSLLLILPPVAAAPHPVPSLEVVYDITNIDFSDVEIAVTGQSCRNFTLGDIGGYFDLPTTSSLTIAVHETLPLSGGFCDGPVLAQYTINYVAGQFYTVYLYEDTSLKPAVSLFHNDVSTIPSGQSRLFVRDAVSIRPGITLNFTLPNANQPHLVSVKLGQQATVELPAGDWQISLLNPPAAVISLRQVGQVGPFGAGELWIVDVNDDPVPNAPLDLWSYQYLLP